MFSVIVLQALDNSCCNNVENLVMRFASSEQCVDCKSGFSKAIEVWLTGKSAITDISLLRENAEGLADPLVAMYVTSGEEKIHVLR